MKNLINYVRLSKIEISKVIFPIKEQIRNAYITVFVVVLIVALFLALVDLIMSTTISHVV